jgi:glutathione peroxidase
MTIRQKLLKIAYPFLMKISKRKRGGIFVNNKQAQPERSFYSLTATDINGMPFQFEQLKGKSVLIVNTASNCGFTMQYAALEKLQQQYAGKLQVLGFPSNDFKNQEEGTDSAIAAFCKTNYKISFPLMKKSVVRKREGQQPVFHWLSTANENGWNNREPVWNFTKYLISKDGVLTHIFPPGSDPFETELIQSIN